MQCSVVKQDLWKLRIGERHKGFQCAVQSARLCIEKQECLWNAAKMLYPQVSELLGMPEANVEQNIRYIAAKGWNNDPEYLAYIAGYEMNRPPAAREFIEILVHHAISVGTV